MHLEAQIGLRFAIQYIHRCSPIEWCRIGGMSDLAQMTNRTRPAASWLLRPVPLRKHLGSLGVKPVDKIVQAVQRCDEHARHYK